MRSPALMGEEAARILPRSAPQLPCDSFVQPPRPPGAGSDSHWTTCCSPASVSDSLMCSALPVMHYPIHLDELVALQLGQCRGYLPEGEADARRAATRHAGALSVVVRRAIA